MRLSQYASETEIDITLRGSHGRETITRSILLHRLGLKSASASFRLATFEGETHDHAHDGGSVDRTRRHFPRQRLLGRSELRDDAHVSRALLTRVLRGSRAVPLRARAVHPLLRAVHAMARQGHSRGRCRCGN